MESNPSPNQPGCGLFRLPRKLREDIYRRVLVVPHPLYLFAEGGSHKVELFAPDRPARWLALLYTNREIHGEAISTLYGSHQFVLVDTSRRQATLLQSFLDLIGFANAGYLRHICINFPAVDKGSEGQVGDTAGSEEATSILWKEDLRVLKRIQEECSSLTTLETYVHNQNSRNLVAAGGQGEISPHTKGALAEVDALFRAIASLKKVIVRQYDGPLKPEVVELMQNFGWIILPGR